MAKFTHKECDVLIQALEAWENINDTPEILMASLFSSMIDQDDPEAKAKFEKSERERKLEFEEKKRERKKISARLKARLYDMQDQAVDEDINRIMGRG